MPKGIKLWFFIKPSRNFMDKSATTNDTKKPRDRDKKSPGLKAPALFIKSNAAAAPIVGTAKRKENSTIVFLLRPRIKPPIMVAAARETPGMTAMD